jgi:hypothetical protein
VGGLIFEELDRRTLTNALAQDNIVLGADHQHLVRTLLSDPSQALQVLGTLTSGLETKILPMFKDSFMAEYGGAMWYLLATCAIGAVLVPLISRSARHASLQNPGTTICTGAASGAPLAVVAGAAVAQPIRPKNALTLRRHLSPSTLPTRLRGGRRARPRQRQPRITGPSAGESRSV